MPTYAIVRHFQDSELDSEVLKRGLTLDEAQEHCNDDETSSRTGTGQEAVERTERYGSWFDAYTDEDNLL